MRRLTMAASIALLVGASLSAPQAAFSAPSDGYAEWSIEGSSGEFSGGLTFPNGFPDATFTSDSLASGNMLPSGDSTWLSDGTSFGEQFGSSRGHEYISLRPARNAVGQPSVTTYTFSSPAVADAWGFALGDIDAEILTVSAVGADGAELTAEQLGYFGSVNYCAAEGGPSCSSDQPSTRVPTMAAAQNAVVLEEPACPEAQEMCDTAGSAGWFSPTVPVSALTVTAEWKSGFPSYQTWFATAANSVSGTLDLDCVVLGGLGLELVNAEGEIVDQSEATPDTEFSLGPVLARSDYRLRVVDAESVPVAVSPDSFDIDLSQGDVAGLALRGMTLHSIRGVAGGLTEPKPISVAATNLVSGVTRTALVDATGAYEIRGVPSGAYELRVVDPADVAFSPVAQTVDVACADATAEPFALTVVPTPTPSPTPAPEPSSTPTPTPAPEPSPTSSPLPTPAPSVTPEPTPTPAPAPSPTAGPEPSEEPTPAPVPSPAPTAGPSPSGEPTPPPAPEPSPAPAAEPTRTAQPAPTSTPAPAAPVRTESPAPEPSPGSTAGPTPHPSAAPGTLAMTGTESAGAVTTGALLLMLFGLALVAARTARKH